MTTGLDWQAVVGRNWAEMYHLTDRSFAGLTQQLLDRVERFPAQQVLDVGCGAGELALALARYRPRTRIVGVDISPELIAAPAGAAKRASWSNSPKATRPVGPVPDSRQTSSCRVTG